MSLGIAYSGYRSGFPFDVYDNFTAGETEIWDESTVDGDGYPAPVTSGNTLVGVGTKYPVGFTLSEFAELFWRKRKIDLVMEGFSRADSVSNSQAWLADFNGSIEEDRGESEANLIHEFDSSWIVGGSVSVPGTHTYYTYDSSGVLDTSSSFNFSVSYQISFSNLVIHNGLYYPRIYVFTVWPGGVNVVSRLLTVPKYLSTKVDPPRKTSEVINIFGTDVPFWIEDDSGSIIYTAGITNASLTATEWWGYGGKFNTATGARA